MEAKHISLTINKKEILKDISLTMKEGEITVFLGPNGSGKTSFFLSMLDLYKNRYEGDIIIRNQSIKEMKPKDIAKEIAFNFQLKQIPDAYVMDVLKLARAPYIGAFGGLSPIDYEKIQRGIELTGIEALLSRNMKTLSGGERQMVFLAMTIIQDAKFMIFDEPDTYLDVQNKKKVFSILKELRNQGKGILLSMHDFQASYQYGDQFYVFSNGILMGGFTKEEVETNTLVEEVFEVKKQKIHTPEGEYYIFY